MNNATFPHLMPTERPRRQKALIKAGLKKRHAAERRFRFYGKLAIFLGLVFLSTLFASIIGTTSDLRPPGRAL